MSTALATTPGTLGASGMPERFANPLTQIRGMLAQPAVRRSLPMALLVGLIAAAALAWMTFSTPTQRTLFAGLPDSDKAAVTAALTQGGIASRVDEGTGALTVADEDYSRARMLLAGQGLPKAAPGGYAILDQLPMGVSRAVEGERLRQARETELARSIEEIDAVAEARVHLAMPETSVFVRDNAAPSASVVLKLQGGRSLSEAQVSSIVNLVASSVPGMRPDAVTLVDQLGALLTHAGSSDPGRAASDSRIDFQRRVEDKYRQQLQQLLTPLFGAGNFTTEVQAEVNLDATQATRETYDRAGQVVRAETGNWTGNQRDGAPGAPGGIPGALSNTPPPASTLSTPQPATGASGAAAGAPATPDRTPVAGGPGVNPEKQSDTFQRAYDNGREVSVTQNAPGGVRRLSVAVLLRDPERNRRSANEIQQITDLVKSAVGFDAARQDQVTVISRKFAGADTGAAAAGPKWYDNSLVPMLARNGTALIIALLVLFLGVRPLAKALMKKREETPAGAQMLAIGKDGMAVAAPVGLDQLAGARAMDERLGAVRGFTRDNPARAALAVRDMIKADGK
ncbi:flagellar basal-body MS-ring/collar protein FliF [Sphingomonas sp.]|uniref:flagellar basal-body MS-ring/collar protein FliF n=1 Tax=Sphingomonas sp. TaxID=28214 RepID=UPI003CC5E8A9